MYSEGSTIGTGGSACVREAAAAKVRLIKAQGVGKKEARDWLLDTAIERAVNSMPQKTDVGRVRHLVQAFESIK